MYCPKCGQLLPDNTRFCSRCGLRLSEVADWLAGSGELSLREKSHPKVLSPKRKGMRFGAKAMFWGAAITPVFLGLSLAVDEPGPLLIPMIVFLAGLSILLYSRLFGEEISIKPSQQVQDLSFGTRPSYNALPPGSNAGAVSSVRREVRTAEIANPPSVTEHTTKLLDPE
jgi:zinc-ribbon domain